jgi:hypothetical protein
VLVPKFSDRRRFRCHACFTVQRCFVRPGAVMQGQAHNQDCGYSSKFASAQIVRQFQRTLA